jgi:hypothetical protein
VTLLLTTIDIDGAAHFAYIRQVLWFKKLHPSLMDWLNIQWQP